VDQRKAIITAIKHKLKIYFRKGREMRSGKKQFGIILTLISLLVIGLVMLAGCEKKTEPQIETESAQPVPQVSAIEQVVCPVMEGPINKEIYTEYKGKKVYFCCSGCKEKFEKEPEKYLSKLPQFN